MASLGEAASIRATILRDGLPHTYTRVPVSAGAEDSEGTETQVPGTPVAVLPCRYRANDAFRAGVGGQETLSLPSIAIRHDDLLAVGETVTNILAADGTTVLHPGPLDVETIIPIAAMGHIISKRAYLRASEPR